ncbi:cupin domain-containing protein [Synergistaceae bacterium OttesenSCG-928-I11]|nr:cupin domain-containing protein [Synergistaceae bacterium OttesenSCG-928-I11]
MKNVEPEEIFELAALVDYQDGQVVSRTIVQSDAGSVTLFSFAQGEAISTHENVNDALVTILDGKGKITIGGRDRVVEKGSSILMPANVPHALEAVEPFKMLLIVG